MSYLSDSYEQARWNLDAFVRDHDPARLQTCLQILCDALLALEGDVPLLTALSEHRGDAPDQSVGEIDGLEDLLAVEEDALRAGGASPGAAHAIVLEVLTAISLTREGTGDASLFNLQRQVQLLHARACTTADEVAEAAQAPVHEQASRGIRVKFFKGVRVAMSCTLFIASAGLGYANVVVVLPVDPMSGVKSISVAVVGMRAAVKSLPK